MGCQPSNFANLQGQDIQPGNRKNRIKKQGKVNQKMAIQQLNRQNVKLSSNFIEEKDLQLAQKTISSHFLFYKLSSIERKKFLQSLQLYQAEANQYVFKKGETATMFFIIKTGEVAIELNNQDKQIKTLKKGDCFGELALIYTAPRSASVKALEKSQFLCISHQIFRKAIQQIVRKNYQLAKSFIDKITLFKYLTRKQKTNLAYHTHSLKFQKDQIIFKEGDDANSFYILSSGSIRMDIPNKKPIIIKQGESFGQNSFKKNHVRSGTAVCLQKVQLLAISRQSISKCLGGQFRQLIFYNIMKWSLKRIPLFNQCSNLVLQKIIGKCQIKKYKNQDVILQKGQKIQCLVLCLQGTINGRQPGSVFNSEFLFKQDLQFMKLTESIQKQGDGFVCFFQFNLLQKLFGGSLFQIMKSNSNREQLIELQVLKKHQLSQMKLQDFKIIKKMGQGQFGVVYHVQDESGCKYALKCINRNKIIENQMEVFTRHQKQIFESIQNPFLVTFYRTFKDKENIYFLLKLIQGKDFFDILRQIGLLNQQTASFYMGCLIQAVQYLHSKNIVYRDLKPQNAVIDKKGYLTVIDLGTAKSLNQDNGFRTFTIIGTPHYMAPQVVQGKGYSFPVDIWAIGVILYEMVCGKLPYGQTSNDPVEIYKQISKSKLKFPKYFGDEDGKELINKLLIKQPEVRSIEQFGKLKNHPYFDNIDWDKLAQKKLIPPYISNERDQRQEFKIDCNAVQYLKELAKQQKTKQMQSILQNWDDIF